MHRVLSLSGVFPVYKPSGPTSARIVEQVKDALLSTVPAGERKSIAKRLKVGHGGTLDPMASGVLVIGINGGTKQLAGLLKGGGKVYEAGMRWGQAYDTYDCTGKALGDAIPCDDLTAEQVQEAINTHFLGTIQQRPPPFSACKVDGKRAYDLARDNQPVELKERPVEVISFEIIDWSVEECKIRVECGGGTYIRSLIHDLAKHLGKAAAMSSLQRTQQSSFTLHDCLKAEDCADLDLLQKRLS